MFWLVLSTKRKSSNRCAYVCVCECMHACVCVSKVTTTCDQLPIKRRPVASGTMRAGWRNMQRERGSAEVRHTHTRHAVCFDQTLFNLLWIFSLPLRLFTGLSSGVMANGASWPMIKRRTTIQCGRFFLRWAAGNCHYFVIQDSVDGVESPAWLRWFSPPTFPVRHFTFELQFAKKATFWEQQGEQTNKQTWKPRTTKKAPQIWQMFN